MKKKIILGLVLTTALCLSASIVSFASWEQTMIRSLPASVPEGVGAEDNFNADGSMLASTITPDNYMVNENGAWVVNGVVQTKKGLASIPTATSESQSQNTATNESQNQNSNIDGGNHLSNGGRVNENGGIFDWDS